MTLCSVFLCVCACVRVCVCVCKSLGCCCACAFANFLCSFYNVILLAFVGLKRIQESFQGLSSSRIAQFLLFAWNDAEAAVVRKFFTFSDTLEPWLVAFWPSYCSNRKKPRPRLLHGCDYEGHRQLTMLMSGVMLTIATYCHPDSMLLGDGETCRDIPKVLLPDLLPLLPADDWGGGLWPAVGGAELAAFQHDLCCVDWPPQ